MLDLLVRSAQPLSDVEVAAQLGIPYPAAGPRLVELYDEGLVEPLPKARKKDRQKYRAVPAERQAAVKQVAQYRARERLLAKFNRQPVWLQGWLVRRILAPDVDVDRQKTLLSEDCPGESGSGECTCPTTNVWVQRHEKRKASWSRVRREATRWVRDQRKHHEDVERAKRDDPTYVQFLTDRGYAREVLHLLGHLIARVEDEVELRRDGLGEIPDDAWCELKDILNELEPQFLELKSAMARMLGHGGEWIEVDGYDDVVEAEILELEPVDDDPPMMDE